MMEEVNLKEPSKASLNEILSIMIKRNNMFLNPLLETIYSSDEDTPDYAQALVQLSSALSQPSDVGIRITLLENALFIFRIKLDKNDRRLVNAEMKLLEEKNPNKRTVTHFGDEKSQNWDTKNYNKFTKNWADEILENAHDDEKVSDLIIPKLKSDEGHKRNLLPDFEVCSGNEFGNQDNHSKVADILETVGIGYKRSDKLEKQLESIRDALKNNSAFICIEDVSLLEDEMSKIISLLPDQKSKNAEANEVKHPGPAEVIVAEDDQELAEALAMSMLSNNELKDPEPQNEKSPIPYGNNLSNIYNENKSRNVNTDNTTSPEKDYAITPKTAPPRSNNNLGNNSGR